MSRAIVNGVPQESLSVSDRGLAYGDGLFETIAVINRKPRFLDLHKARLAHGLGRLAIKTNGLEPLWDEVREFAQGQKRAVIKIIVTRGKGERGYRLPSRPKPTRIVQLTPWPDYAAERCTDGVSLRQCSLRLGHSPQLAGLKHLNRLEQVMARAEWSDPDIAEGLLLDQHDHVIGGTMSNIFIAAGNEVVTPLLDQCGVAGVMRQAVMDAVRQLGIGIREARLQLTDITGGEEVFLTNSLFGIWPVRSFDSQSWEHFPLVRQLSSALGLNQ